MQDINRLIKAIEGCFLWVRNSEDERLLSDEERYLIALAEEIKAKQKRSRERSQSIYSTRSKSSGRGRVIR
jgi:hypothetical protein